MNPVGSKYCQHCGTSLHVKVGKVARVNNCTNKTKEVVRSKDVAVIPLTKRQRNISGRVIPRMIITPHEDGTWFCPLCGDKNTGLGCKSCGFEVVEKAVSR